MKDEAQDSDYEKQILEEVLQKRCMKFEEERKPLLATAMKKRDDDEESGVSTDFDYLITTDDESIGSGFSDPLSEDDRRKKKTASGKRLRGQRAGRKLMEKKMKQEKAESKGFLASDKQQVRL